MKRKLITGIIAAIYIILLVIISASWLWQIGLSGIAAAVTNSVAFEEGVFKKDVTELTLVLHEGEAEKLSELTALRTLDLRGSDCTAELYAWAQAHPDVAVSYDVPLPDGTRADRTATTLSFAAATADTLPAYTAALEYLPDVTAVDLGTDEGEAYPAATLSALESDYPDIAFTYAFSVQGIFCSLDQTELDLSSADKAAVDALKEYLPCMPGVQKILLGDESTTKLDWGTIAALTELCPNADFDYTFTLYGKTFTLADETIDLSKTQYTDNGDAVLAALPALYRCKIVDMDDGGVVPPLGNERMAELQKAAGDGTDVVWRIWFGTLYSVRTDTERILASKPSVGGMIDNAEAAKLQYCTKVKYLDIGHNEVITDISFVESMPDLEVFIIAMNPVSDLTPLTKCTKLEYLEIFTTAVTDVSALSSLTSLRHLNICNLPGLSDISPLYSLTELERLWIGTKTPIPADQVAQMQQSAPSCKISTVSDDEQGDAWRYTWYDENNATYHWTERHEKLREQLGYNYQEYSFYWLDPACALPAPAEYVGVYYGKPAGA